MAYYKENTPLTRICEGGYELPEQQPYLPSFPCIVATITVIGAAEDVACWSYFLFSFFSMELLAHSVIAYFL